MPFRTIAPKDYDVSKVQDNAAQAFTELYMAPFIGGLFLNGVVLVGGSADTVIQHKLTHKVTGWIVTKKNATSDIFDSSTVNNIPELQFILKATNAVTVNLYVF